VGPHAGTNKINLSSYAETSKSKEYTSILFSKSESLKGVKKNKKVKQFDGKIARFILVIPKQLSLIKMGW
jgi:hypothetical protein